MSAPSARVFATLLLLAGALPAHGTNAQGTTGGGSPPVTPTDGVPVFFPDGKRIAFTTTRDGGRWRIHVMSADGTGERALTNDLGSEPANEMSAAVSPDGRRIIVVRISGLPGPSMKTSLVSVAPDGSDLVVLSDLFLSQGPAWSPDGHRIAFVAGGPPATPGTRPRAEIHLMNSDGSGKTTLLPGDPTAFQIGPKWSPDGHRIIYETADSAQHFHIMIVNADGSSAHPLGPPGSLGIQGEWASWSPDGRHILFGAARGGEKADIYVVNADGSGERRLTDSPARDEVPNWSPDGRQIIFQSDRDGAMTLYLMNADGTNVRRLRP